MVASYVKRTRLAGLILAVALAACAGNDRPRDRAPEDAPGTRLTVAEMRANFIGKPWRGTTGTYTFRPDGTYSYRSETTTLTFDAMPYRLTDDGVLKTDTTTFTFYRIGTAFRYYNSGSGEFFLARPATQ